MADILLDSGMAALALVAQADGKACIEERSLVLALLERTAEFKGLDHNQALAAFMRFSGLVAGEGDAGTKKAWDAVALAAEHPDLARIVVHAAIALSQADGTVASVESKILVEMCRVLKLDPASFR